MTTTDHLITYNVYNLRLLCRCDTSIGRTEAELTRHLLDAGRDEGRREGYAAGLAAAKGEQVAAEDPRVKPGARVRVEEIDGHGDMVAREGIVREISLYRNGRVLLSVAGVLIDGATSIYLLAEAPDPDAEVLDALEAADEDSCTYAGMLDALRERGFDVVKVVAK